MFILLGVFLFLILLGLPIATCMLASSISYMIAYKIPFDVIPQRLAAGVDSFPLLAVAFFVLAGIIMNQGSITTRIFSFADHLVGHYTGGLAHANVLASIVFAGMSGSAIADIGGLGAIELKAMKDAGYDEDFSLAVTGASSLIGPIIPPSVPLIIFGVTASVSVGDLFRAGLIPGLLLATLMLILNYIIIKNKNYQKKTKSSGREIWLSFKYAFLSLLLPIIIRGGIILAIFTPTEASIFAVVYGLGLGMLYKNIKLRDIPKLVKETLNVTTGVLYMLACATLFSWVLTYSQIPQKISIQLMHLTNNPIIALFIISGILFFIGLFMDITPAIVIMVPVLLPFVVSLNIDLVLFGLIMVINLLIGLVTPPIGMALFVLSKISNISVERIARAIVPYISVTILLIILLIFYTVLVIKNPELQFLY